MAKYADEDLIDPNKVLLAHMEKSDDEDEHEMKHWGFLDVEPAPIEPKEAQTPETLTSGQRATMGMSPEESVAQSPELTLPSQTTKGQPPPSKKKKIEVDDL